MRLYQPITPPKDFDPRLVRILKSIDDYLRDTNSAIASLGRGQSPDQGRGVIADQPGVVDHGNLAGLTPVEAGSVVIDYNDDHTQYALLDGRPAGQYLWGSRAADIVGWDPVGTFTVDKSTTDGTSFTFTVDNSAPVGYGVFLILGSWQTGTSTGETSYHTSITDATGNTWTKLKECTAYKGASAEVTCSVWYSEITNALTGGSSQLTFNITPTSSKWSAEGYMFNVGAGADVNVVGSTFSFQQDEYQPDSLALTATGSTLYLRASLLQPFSGAFNPLVFTPTGGFVSIVSDHTNSTLLSTDWGFGVRGEFKISTEGVTSSPTRDNTEYCTAIANIYLAIQINPGSSGILNLGSSETTQAASILLTGSTIKANQDFFQWRAPGGTTTLSYIDGSDGSFHGPVVASSLSISPALNLLNTSLFGDVLAGTVARGSLIVGNSTPKWSALSLGASYAFLVSDGSDAVWDTQPTRIKIGAGATDFTTIYNDTLLGGPVVELSANQSGGSGALPIIKLDDSTGTVEITVGAGDGLIQASSSLSLSGDAGITALTLGASGTITAFPTMATNIAMGGNDITGLDDVTLNADNASEIGTSTVGMKTIHFAQNTDNGLHFIDATNGDFYVGSDHSNPNYYSQKTMKAGSTPGEAIYTATNLFQGAWGSGATPLYPFIEMNYFVGDGSVGRYPFGLDGATYIVDGSVIIGRYDGGALCGGGGLLISGRGGSANQAGLGLYISVDSTNTRAILRTMSANASKAAQQISKISFAGSQLTSVIPETDNVVDLGIATTNRWKNVYYHGTLTSTISGSAISLADGGNIVLGTSTGTKIGTGTTQKLGFFNATPVVRPSAYTPTNVTTDRSYDANDTSLNEVADVLGTLIADLQSLGLIG